MYTNDRSNIVIAKQWKQIKCPSTEKQINKCGIVTQWNII